VGVGSVGVAAHPATSPAAGSGDGDGVGLADGVGVGLTDGVGETIGVTVGRDVGLGSGTGLIVVDAVCLAGTRLAVEDGADTATAGALADVGVGLVEGLGITWLRTISLRLGTGWGRRGDVNMSATALPPTVSNAIRPTPMRASRALGM
jgi:hypothetical protein